MIGFLLTIPYKKVTVEKPLNFWKSVEKACFSTDFFFISVENPVDSVENFLKKVLNFLKL